MPMARDMFVKQTATENEARIEKLLAKFREKCVNRLQENLEQKKEQLLKQDSRISKICSLMKEIEEIYVENGYGTDLVDIAKDTLNIQSLSTDETDGLIYKKEELVEKAINKVGEIFKDTLLLCKMADTFQEKVAILRDAGIMREDTLEFKPVNSFLTNRISSWIWL